ncbi:MAG: sigma-70 family RNA polymerase sigma factor [Myxococcota bacterium]|nr:sigma-70 family RNA polymerase sigma factor [Myxococcota bacterium]
MRRPTADTSRPLPPPDAPHHTSPRARTTRRESSSHFPRRVAFDVVGPSPAPLRARAYGVAPSPCPRSTNPAASASRRDDLLRRGLPLVRRIAFRLARRLPPCVDVGDLVGAGCEGLLRAIASYDAARDAAFEAYAEMRIRGAMFDELRRFDPVTRHGRRRMAQIGRTIRALESHLGRPPDDDAVAEALGIDIERYHRVCDDLSRAPALACSGEVDPDSIADPAHEDLEPFDRAYLRSKLTAVIATLPERQRRILVLYYAEQRTQAEIGRLLGITESRVCQVLAESVAQLRILLAGSDEVPAAA